MELKDNSRRQFIKQNSIAGIGFLTMTGTSLNTMQPDPTNSACQPSEIKKIGNFSFEQLRDIYQAYLFEKFIPNMDKLVIDHQHGGFMCNVDIAEWKVLSTDKKAWFEGRGIWIYSFLYNNFQKDPKFLEIAEKSRQLVMKLKPADNSFWPSSFDQLGSPVSRVGARYGNQFGIPASAAGDIYGNMFIAEGLAEYSIASGKEEYYDTAREMIFNCLAAYDKPDYNYQVNYLDPDVKSNPGSRVLGHWMIFLRSITQMLEKKKDAELEALAGRCVDAIMNHHLNPEYDLVNEVLNHDLSRPDNEFSNFSYLGHGIETLWMVMAEAIRKKDSELFEKTRNAFKRHVTVATDDVYGGIFQIT